MGTFVISDRFSLTKGGGSMRTTAEQRKDWTYEVVESKGLDAVDSEPISALCLDIDDLLDALARARTRIFKATGEPTRCLNCDNDIETGGCRCPAGIQNPEIC